MLILREDERRHSWAVNTPELDEMWQVEMIWEEAVRSHRKQGSEWGLVPCLKKKWEGETTVEGEESTDRLNRLVVEGIFFF